MTQRQKWHNSQLSTVNMAYQLMVNRRCLFVVHTSSQPQQMSACNSLYENDKMIDSDDVVRHSVQTTVFKACLHPGLLHVKVKE